MKQKLLYILRKYRRSFLIIFIIFSAIALLMTCWFRGLWSFLIDFQNSIPYAPVSEIVDSLKEGSYDEFIMKVDNLPAELKDAKNYAQYVQENTNPEDVIYYAEKSSDQSNQKMYDIKIGKTKIMEVVMESQEKKSFFNFPQYYMKSCVANPLTSYTITNYSDDSLIINQKELPQQYFVEEISRSDNGVDIPYSYSTYKIDDLMYIQDIKLSQHESVVEFDHETNEIFIYNKIDEATQKEIEEFTLTALHPYLIFSTANLGSRENILQYVYPYSNLNYSINEYFNTYGMLYVADELRNLVIDDFIAYSDTEFYCHVSVDYVVTQSDGIQKEYKFKKGFYMTTQNGYYQLVDMVNE